MNSLCEVTNVFVPHNRYFCQTNNKELCIVTLMDTYATRLKWAMKEDRDAPVGQTELAKAVGCRPQTIQHLLDPKKNAQGSRYTAAIAQYLAVSAIWLATGKGEPRPWAITPEEFAAELISLSPDVEPGPEIKGQVPLISWVQAGSWCETIDIFEPGTAEEWMPCPVNHGTRTFVLRVRGPSMHNPHGRPSFQDGDLIFVDPDREAVNGSPVVVRLDDDNEATFKQLVIEGGKRYLKALNPAWPDQIIQINSNATICGVVIFKGEEV